MIQRTEQGDEVDADAEDAAIEAEDDELAEQSEEAVDTGDANQVEPGESDLDGAAAESLKERLCNRPEEAVEAIGQCTENNVVHDATPVTPYLRATQAENGTFWNTVKS